MKIILYIFLILANINLAAQKIENNSYNNNYIYKDGILYLCYDSVEYSGNFIEYYPGRPKITGSFKNGLKDGPFCYYDSENNIIKIENYTNGKRHGLCKTYYFVTPFIKNLTSKEVFSNDSLVSGYYWHSSGQILKTIINRDTTHFRIDSSIFTIVPHIRGLNFNYYSESQYTISKNDLCSSINSPLSIICLGYNGHTLETGYDTITRADYKIKSYYIEGSVYKDKRTGGHLDFNSGLVVDNNLRIEYRQSLCDLQPEFLYFSRIVILDKNNIEYEINNIKIYINE